MIFIKTTDYKENIRKTGNLKPKVKSIVSSTNYALEKLEETKSKIPEVIMFDLMERFHLIFHNTGKENEEAIIKIYILTYAQYDKIMADPNI